MTTSTLPEAKPAAEARFPFGANWHAFLSVLTEERIALAEQSLRDMLGTSTLEGKSFIDIGSGSGLFSLAAMRLGAARVHSFDYDPQSVGCAQELRHRYFPSADHWTIEQGSALDPDYLRSLGQWDIVYSWGVLHHTGAMWPALTNVAPLVRDGGTLFIALYNDQGPESARWKKVKALYNSSRLGKWLVVGSFIPYFIGKGLVKDVLTLKNPLTRYRQYKQARGMSRMHDWLDWLGGYPFEVAKPEEVFDFYLARGFELRRLKTCAGGLGCNEFVFLKN
jgi:2-polyprenyl-6-hydroxyphenyl methylase/3-demethylubiquinone-9 3-methyltransferase